MDSRSSASWTWPPVAFNPAIIRGSSISPAAPTTRSPRAPESRAEVGQSGRRPAAANTTVGQSGQLLVRRILRALSGLVVGFAQPLGDAVFHGAVVLEQLLPLGDTLFSLRGSARKCLGPLLRLASGGFVLVPTVGRVVVSLLPFAQIGEHEQELGFQDVIFADVTKPGNERRFGLFVV